MNDRQIETIEQVRDFLAASAVMEFSVESVAERYAWVEATLGKFRYGTLSKTHKGLLRRYLQRITGYSRQQLTRLMGEDPSFRLIFGLENTDPVPKVDWHVRLERVDGL